jgi:three-Cys-motif partner protein
MFELPPPLEDGLFTPEVGSWSIHKHHFLRRYVDAFTTSMRRKRWSGLHYIDLFASAGLERIKDSGALEWGSPLIAAQAPHPFARLHLCELDKNRFEALQARIGRFQHRAEPQLIMGDANVVVSQVTASLPPRSLSLAFLDPHGLHLNFDTLRVLSRHKVDLIIFFPDHLDALRNWEAVYHGNPNSNLDRVLGTATWRERLNATAKSNWAQALSDLYVDQIRSLGYTHFEAERISLPTGRFLYKLVFCSTSDVGAKIWRGISMRKADGQSTFNFGND